MKEFDYELKDIFTGLVAERVTRKGSVKLLDCHNLEPVDGDYQLHALVIDLNATGYSWGNP